MSEQTRETPPPLKPRDPPPLMNLDMTKVGGQQDQGADGFAAVKSDLNGQSSGPRRTDVERTRRSK